MKLKQPALPLKTIEDNLDLVFDHEIFLAFDNPSYMGGLFIMGTDHSNTCLVEYCPSKASTILLEPEYVRDLATDAEPFYMNYAAVIAYCKEKNK
jgi:hypothetical protein